MRSKLDRRKYYRGLKESFSADQYTLWNQGLKGQLKSLLKTLPKGQTIAVYSAKDKEADLSGLFESGHRFCFPIVTSMEKAQMEFRVVEQPANPKMFEKGAYEILEPKKQGTFVGKEEIQICFLPLLAFDGQGNRMGQGKGFYDRFLNGFQGLKIGVGFEWQFSPQPLPVEDHDQPLDIIVTEHQVRDFRKAKKSFTAPKAKDKNNSL